MADNESESSGWGGGIVAAIGVFLGTLAYLGYKSGWFDRLFGKETAENQAAKAEAAQRRDDFDKAKPISLAAHNFHDAENHFPTNIHDKDGKPLLSWRVELLPHMGYKELYDKFKKEEPWDSDHNKKLLVEMPKEFAIGNSNPAQGLTTVQGFEASADQAKKANIRPLFVTGDSKGIDYGAVHDGTANSTMFVEAAKPVPWSKPEDIPLTPDVSLRDKIGLRPGHRPVMGMLDGSLHALKENISNEKLRAFATVNGGEVIREDERPTGPNNVPNQAGSQDKSL